MHHRQVYIKTFSVVLVLMLLGCDGKDGRKIWKDVLQKCANNDLLGRDVLYFGPSNNVGVGSIWRKANDGSYHPRIIRAKYAPDDNSFVIPGSNFQCEGTTISSSKISPTLALGSKLDSLNGSFGVDFNRAKKVTVQVDQLEWETLEEIPWEQKIKQLATDDPVKEDLFKPSRYILVTALRVKGMVAKLEFSSEVAAELKTKYKGADLGRIGTGDLDAGFTAKFTSETTLEITSPNDFYIAGELREVHGTGISGPEKLLGAKATGLEKATVGRDSQ